MLITGILYDQDYEDPNTFKSRDFVYGFVSMIITSLFYLIGYFLLRIREKDEGFLWRKVFGYVFVGLMFGICTIFVFVFTYKVHDDTDTDFTRLVDHWMAAFGYSMLLEVLVSENIRVLTRTAILWSKRFDPEEPMQTNIELSSIDRHKAYEIESFD
jgi:peptidoglycan/LPS O-acetylase OafA/YrhL